MNTALQAIPSHGVVDLLVNGNPPLAASLAKLINLPSDVQRSCKIRVWNIPLGDKANAWNTYIHQIWESESLVFFIDGYVRLRPDSLRSMASALASRPSALGGTGVPTIGRSAERLRREMLTYGGFHGNLCCVRGSVIAEMRKRNIRIPLGLYRVDSLMGAILTFGLNPLDNAWEPSRIVVVETSSWDLDMKSPWRWDDWVGKGKQLERQFRGEMENAAVKFLFTVLKHQPEGLPADVRALVEGWKAVDQVGFQRFVLSHPLPALAYRRHCRQLPDWSRKDEAELLVQMKASDHGRG
ncbi:hypothetical protein [Hydrogenophaga sp.]|uniref:hypothetical protein n=1 Tax=Hydrogenophaga sp. TaxID=1904254 RepID=UPI00271C8011|nr:hypothetical protein [Hydrogenophaga sp.]MDO9504989.1 hypothetical protein [Hydrogenophaga sp.]